MVKLAILHSRAQVGVEAPPVTIEVCLDGGLPATSIVGLPETAVRESRDRVRAAIKSAQFEYPANKTMISLGPADLKKTGGRFDLPIALGIIAANQQIPQEAFDRYEFYGELSLSGDIRPVPGVLPSALRAGQAGRSVFVPKENGLEATYGSADVYVAGTLLEVTAHLTGCREAARPEREQVDRVSAAGPDLSEVRGQRLAKRALEIAAAGGHNILFSGPPGTGKSMLASRLPGILPPMTESEAIETASVDSVLGRRFDPAAWMQRPFRAPHHTASAVALVGGGSNPCPGEISRAHNGVLFLDELPEFSRHVLESLREPMETGVITISRAARQADFPARFQLVAAMNPCPCGYLGDPRGDCRCSADRVSKYRDRLSGPFMDRIDIQMLVQRPSHRLLRPDAPSGEPSSTVAERVRSARAIQLERAGVCNAGLGGQLLETTCETSPDGWALLERAVERFNWSARVHHRIRRVARTIADLDSAGRIGAAHMGEALGLRQLDRDQF